MSRITSKEGLNASGGRKQQQKKVLQKTNSDYVRCINVLFSVCAICVRQTLFFHFVPYDYVLDKRYFSVCAMCVC